MIMRTCARASPITMPSSLSSTTPPLQVYETAAEIAAEEENIRRHTTPAYRAPEVGFGLLTQPRPCLDGGAAWVPHRAGPPAGGCLASVRLST